MMETSPDWLHWLYDGSALAVGYTSRGLDAVHQKFDESYGAYEGFNICHYTGDETAHVDSCRQKLCDALGVGLDSLIVPRQTHSVNVLVVDKPMSMGRDTELDGVDAVVTSTRGLVIGVSTADCLPVVIYDRNAGVAGVAHAGWRGAVGGIIDRTVDTMIDMGASASCMSVWFGPAICAGCFEVGEEVASRFPASCVERQSGLKPHVNLPEFAVGRLIESGVEAKNIHPFSTDLCTRCHPSRYFSARASGVNSGRNFTFVMLK